MNAQAAYTNERISIDRLRFLVDKLADSEGLSTAVHSVLSDQIERLGHIYGKDIVADEALRIISKQVEITRSGYFREPIGIVEFIESPEYMNQGEYVRPAIMEHLYKLFENEDQYYEVVLGGAIGIGKNYFADMAVAYILYKMSCLYSPQSYYGLAPGSDIVFIHQSRSLQLARKVIFNQFAGRLRASGYFPRHFNFSAGFRAQLLYPNNISVVPVSSSDTAALGMNIFTAVLDELNFMGRIKHSKMTRYTGIDEYDQAEKLYMTIHRRLESRFQKLGKVPGKLFLISSANYKGDFIDRKEKEAETNLNIYVMHLSQWDALPSDTYCGKKFYVVLPSEKSKGTILDDKPKDMKGVISVPTEHRQSFDLNLIDSLRDIGGIATERKNRIIDTHQVETAFKLYETIYGNEQVFKESATVIGEDIRLDGIRLEKYLDLDFLQKIKNKGPFGAHIDLALTRASAAIGIGHVVGSKDIGSRTVFNSEKGKFETQAYGDLPVYAIVGLLKILPPKTGEINLNLIRDILFLISDYIKLQWITLDIFQSASIIQAFRARGIASYVVSMDKTPAAYLETKYAMEEERVYAPRNLYFEQEMDNLEQDARTGKIDHITGGSKDVSDVVAGVVYEFSRKRMSYRHKGNPTAVTKSEVSSRPSVSRPSSGRDSLY